LLHLLQNTFGNSRVNVHDIVLLVGLLNSRRGVFLNGSSLTPNVVEYSMA